MFTKEEKEKKFKTDFGNYITKGLFYEQSYDPNFAIYSLRGDDRVMKSGNVYKSLYRLYMDKEDLTEWEFANECFYDWDHWISITECTWFKPFIAKWRKELELKIKGNALKFMLDEARFGGKNQFLANKYLLEKGYVTPAEKTSTKQSVGRPVKTIDQELLLDSLTNSDKKILEDLEIINKGLTN